MARRGGFNFIIHDGRYFYEPITKFTAFTATEYVHSSSNIPHHTMNTQSVSSVTTLWYVTVHASFTYNGTLQ